jgi:hypothetical protein
MRFAALLINVALAAGAAAIVNAPLAQERPRVERFTIDVPASVLRDLDERLARTRWPDQLPGTDWSYGADTAYLRELLKYWQDGYDWRAQERALNRFEHYRASTLTSNGHGPDHRDAKIVVGEAETLAYVLDRSRAAGLAWDTGHVRAVLDAELAYLEAIGALGPGEDG